MGKEAWLQVTDTDTGWWRILGRRGESVGVSYTGKEKEMGRGPGLGREAGWKLNPILEKGSWKGWDYLDNKARNWASWGRLPSCGRRKGLEIDQVTEEARLDGCSRQ